MSTSNTDPEPLGENSAPAWLAEWGQGAVEGLNRIHEAQQRKTPAQAWAQGAVDKLNRMRADEAYRQQIAAKAK